MANNTVELIIDLKLEGKKDLAKYSQELKVLSKILSTIEKQNSKQANSIKQLNQQQKEAVNVSVSQVAANKNLVKSQTNLIGVNNKVVKSIKEQVAAQKSLENTLKGISNEAKGGADSGAKLNQSFDSSKLAKYGGTVGKVASVIGGLSAAAVGAAAAIAAMVVNSAKAQKEMELLSRQAKLSQIDFEALAFATSQYGINAEQIADISKDVYDKLGDYVTAAAGPFQNFADVMGLTKDEARDLAREFQHMTSPQIITEMVRQLESVGASSAQVINVLEAMGNDLSKLDVLFSNNGESLKALSEKYKSINEQLTLTEEQTKNLTEVSVNFDLFTQSMQKSTSVISAELAPVLADFFGQLAKNIPGITKHLEAFIHSFREIENMTNFKALNNTARDARANLSDLNKELERQEKILEKQQKNPKSGYSSQYTNENMTLIRISKLQADIAKEKNDLERAEKRIKDLRLEEAKANKESLKIEKEKNKEKEKSANKGGTGQGTAGAVDDLQALKESFLTEEQRLKQKYEKDLKLAENNEELKKQIKQRYDDEINAIKLEKEKDLNSKIQNNLRESLQEDLTQIDNLELKFDAKLITKDELETEVLKLQEEANSKIEKLDVSQIEKANQKLRLQQSINSLLVDEKNEKEKIVDAVELQYRNDLELARVANDKLKAIEAERVLKNYLTEKDSELTESMKKQQVLQNDMVAKQQELNLEKQAQDKIEKDILLKKEKQLEAEAQALRDIQNLRFELAEAQGIDTSVDKLEDQRKNSLLDIENSNLSLDTKKIQSDLINSIFDERVIDAKFEMLLNKYNNLISDMKNASPSEAVLINNQIGETVNEISNLDLNSSQFLELKTATDEWQESLKSTNYTLNDLANSIKNNFESSFKSFLDGTKSGKEAFRDFALTIIDELLSIQVAAMTNDLFGLNSGGGFTGGGLFGGVENIFNSITDLFKGFSLPYFHKEGSPSDPMLDTRPVTGLNSDEMLSVIKKNEKVIHNNTYRDLMANGGNQAPIINQSLVLDPSDLQQSIGKTDRFATDVVSIISAQSRQIKDILG